MVYTYPFCTNFQQLKKWKNTNYKPTEKFCNRDLLITEPILIFAKNTAWADRETSVLTCNDGLLHRFLTTGNFSTDQYILLVLGLLADEILPYHYTYLKAFPSAEQVVLQLGKVLHEYDEALSNTHLLWYAVFLPGAVKLSYLSGHLVLHTCAKTNLPNQACTFMHKLCQSFTDIYWRVNNICHACVPLFPPHPSCYNSGTRICTTKMDKKNNIFPLSSSPVTMLV